MLKLKEMHSLNNNKLSAEEQEHDDTDSHHGTHDVDSDQELSGDSLHMEGEDIDISKFIKEKKIFQRKALQILDIPKTLDESVFVVSFNEQMQIINLVAQSESRKRIPYALSIYIDSKYMGTNNIAINEGCPFEVTRDTLPKRRNVFEIQSVYERNNLPLKFMEEFYIKLSDSGSDKKFYVACSNPSFETAGKRKRDQRYPLYLTETTDDYCKFMCVSWDEMRNRACEYVTIELTTRIRHIKTDTFLSSNINETIPSFCGESYRVECISDDKSKRPYTYWVICPDINSASSDENDDNI